MDWTSFRVWVVDRLKETSTWAGIMTGVVAFTGVTIAPEKTTAILSAGTAAATAIGILFRDPPKQ